MSPRRLSFVLIPTALVVALLRSLAFVPDADMAPSYLRGDLVLITPGVPAAGDVVAVIDPLAPEVWTLRRVIAIGGAVRYVNGVFKTGGETQPVVDMGTLEGLRVHKQGEVLVQTLDRPIRDDVEERGVPDDAAYLGADARDEAMDSRWWGAVPLGAIQGVVRLRIGAPKHAWRGWVDV